MVGYTRSSFSLTSTSALNNVPGTKTDGIEASLINSFIKPSSTYVTSTTNPFVNGQAVIFSGDANDTGYPQIDGITATTLATTTRVDGIIAYDQRTNAFYPNDAVGIFSVRDGGRVMLLAGVAFNEGDLVYWNVVNQYATNVADVGTTTTACFGIALRSAPASVPGTVSVVPVQLQVSISNPIA